MNGDLDQGILRRSNRRDRQTDLTRVRQATASRETATLSPRAREHQRQCLDRAPDMGAPGLVLFWCALSQGPRERPGVSALPSFLRPDKGNGQSASGQSLMPEDAVHCCVDLTNDVVGPVSEPELERRAEDGVLRPMTRVSCNRRSVRDASFMRLMFYSKWFGRRPTQRRPSCRHDTAWSSHGCEPL